MSVDIFGNEIKQSGTIVKSDDGISLSFANNTYVRLDGDSKITGNLNMALRKIENLGKPTNPLDATTKEYVDNTKGTGIIGEVKDNTAKIKGNMDFNEQYKIQNLPLPIDEKDAVNKEYSDRRDINLERNNPFFFNVNAYEAKDDINLKGFKISEVSLPFEDGDVATKEYVDTSSISYLKVNQGIYEANGNIDMKNAYTVFNVKPPTDDSHITDKKYVDDNSAFNKKNGGFEARGGIYMRKNKLGGLREPTQDGEAATKKYVDDLQTQHVDEKGNIKFGRNINLDNRRIFALKEPRKDNEAATKKYVDDSITDKIEEEKVNFLPADPATKTYVDEAICGLVGGDIAVSKEGVFIKDNGYYRATAPLNIDNQKMENLPVPEEDGDAANKKYIDDIVENLTLKQGLIRENGGFNLTDSYINMNFNRIRNLGEPSNISDAVTKNYVDDAVETNFKRFENRITELNQLVSAVGSCYETLKKSDYQFTFGGPILNGKLNKLDRFNGFLVPAPGLLKNFVSYSTGIITFIPEKFKNKNINDTVPNLLIKLFGSDTKIKLFSLIKIGESGKEMEVLGEVFFSLSGIIKFEDERHFATPKFEFILKEKYLNKDDDFICSVNRGDIINIRTEYSERENNEPGQNIPLAFVRVENEIWLIKDFYLHTATLTFLFKEMSFPSIFDEMEFPSGRV